LRENTYPVKNIKFYLTYNYTVQHTCIHPLIKKHPGGLLPVHLCMKVNIQLPPTRSPR
jgi:hypothetical protein